MKHDVVLADDVASIRAVVRAALETDGRFVIVGETADGPTTVEMVDALGPDLLVLDLSMPASDGIATLAGIAARHPGLGIVVYSERVDQERLALAAGASTFVRKSADVSELLDALETAATRLAPKPLRPGEIQDFERLVLDAIDEGFVVQDSGGAIVYANPAAERILDLRADEMVGLTSKDPRWGAVLPDGTPFPADEHPIVRARLTGRCRAC